MTRSIGNQSAIALFFRNLPDTLQQPVAMAMMGSVGAHILFFATLPAFTPVETDNPDREIRRVQVVELPKENGALPPLRSPFGLPAVPSPKATLSTPVPNSPKAQNPKVQFGQPSSVLVPPNPLYTPPDLSSPIPSNAQSQKEFSRILQELNKRQPRSVIIPKTDQPRPRPRRSQQTIPTQPLPTQPLPTQPPPQTEVTPDSSAPLALSPGGLRPFDPSIVGVNPPSTGTPNQQPSAPLPPQAATPLPPQAAATPSPTPPLTARNDELLMLTRYNPEGTNLQKDNRLLVAWFNNLKEKGINAPIVPVWNWNNPTEQLDAPKLEQPIPELPYPLSFPLNNYKQHPVIVMVLVDPEGNLIEKPKVVQSTGYEVLNEAAIKEVEKQIEKQPKPNPYPKAEGVRAYQYKFQFKAPASPATASAPQAPAGN
jgi:hypothetical protein